MNKYILSVLLFILFVSCGQKKIIIEHRPAPVKEVLQVKPTTSIKLATFNIQIFGKTKAKKVNVMNTISKIIKNFDIVAIQEIREKTNTAIKTLIKKLGPQYTYIIGPRLGNSSSKEQYAYVYKKNKIKLISVPYTYNDINDYFEREPYIARFKVKKGNLSFVLINTHIKPKQALKEINKLDDVVYSVQKKFLREDDFIVLGDMNADCNYLDELSYNDLKSKNFIWLIKNNLDTTVAKSKCTYDRIVATKDIREDYTGISGVFRFDKYYNLDYKSTKKVSDHYPVFVKLYTSRDN